MSTTAEQALPPARPVTPVAILAEELAAISERLEAVEGLDPALRARVRRAHALASGLEPYLSAVTTPESAGLALLAERTRAHDWGGAGGAGALEAEMLSGHVEGQVLKFLVRLVRARRVLEIGMFTGYSALAMAEALPDDGRVVACEIDPAVARFARGCLALSPHGHKVEVRVGEALTTLAALARGAGSGAPEPFDLVFLDADKAGYTGYLTALLEGGLLAEHGVVCADNTLMQGRSYLGDAAGGTGAGTEGDPAGPAARAAADGASIAAFNAAVAADPRVEQVVLPLRDGLTLIRRVAGGAPARDGAQDDRDDQQDQHHDQQDEQRERTTP